MKLEVQEWQVRFTLQALCKLEKEWGDTAATCNDEDLAADLGNDLIRLTAAYDYVERLAVEAFGPGVRSFCRESTVPATAQTADPLHPY